MVLEEGLEPSRSFEQKILSLLCLPIPPPEQNLLTISKSVGFFPFTCLLYYACRLLTRIAATRPGAHSYDTSLRARSCIRSASCLARRLAREAPAVLRRGGS